MHRLVTTLCLLLALTSPLLSQARVAYGLGLSFAEIGHNSLESSEEGADEAYDAQEGIAITALTAAGAVLSDSVPAALDSFALLPHLNPPPSAFSAVHHRHGLWMWPPQTAARHHALLHVFLI
jgi:hypothetical protein